MSVNGNNKTGILTMGVDIGSASCKAVILEDGKRVVAEAVVQAGTGSSGQGRVFTLIFGKAGVSWDDLDYTVATGYGRMAVKQANKQISEITCHGKGIAFLCPTARTVIDIGGQDAKAIGLNERGDIVRFFMNDKCAAGTGRFLENIARVLETELNKMGDCHFLAQGAAPVSSTCAVFAESEVISLLSNGIPKNDIIAGVHQVIATRACALANRVGVVNDVVMCGGVALDAGAVDAIQNQLGHNVTVAPNPQLTGAFGAALLAHGYAKSAAARQWIGPQI
jgi:predicted CoA-substrate-specific enzyme activase